MTTSYCMWCGEILSQEEGCRSIQGHWECSICAALDGKWDRLGLSKRDAARISILECLRSGIGREAVVDLPLAVRKQLRPSTYATLAVEQQKEIDLLLGVPPA